MHYKLVKAPAKAAGTMEKLMQLYIYDFSEFVDRDVTENGLFEPYPNLDECRSLKEKVTNPHKRFGGKLSTNILEGNLPNESRMKGRFRNLALDGRSCVNEKTAKGISGSSRIVDFK